MSTGWIAYRACSREPIPGYQAHAPCSPSVFAG